MQFGLSFLPDCTTQFKTAKEYFEEAIELCQIADRAGLNYIKMTEHYLHPYGGYCPSPLIFLSAIAACTSQIKLLTGCVLPIFHHPIQIASHTALVDTLSKGRLEVGFARAYLPYEFEAFEVSMNESRKRYETTIKTVIDLWKNKNHKCKTPYFEFENVTTYPRCTQKPHPPVWGAAVNSRQTFAWLGENLFNLLVTPPFGSREKLVEMIDLYKTIFRSVAKEIGVEKEPKVLMSIPLIVNEKYRDAIEESEKYLAHYINIWSSATKSLLKNESQDYPNYKKIYNILSSKTPEKMREEKLACIGDVKYVEDFIKEMEETYNLDGIIWQIDFGEQPITTARRSLDLIINKVIPNINKKNQLIVK